LNNHWGYSSTDADYKSEKQVVRALVECVSKNGNLLLNVGPDAYGEIPCRAINILREVGIWMGKNARSIYCCGNAILIKPEWGRYTQNGKFLYAHIMERSIGPVNINGLEGKIKCAHLLSDGSEISLKRPWNVGEYPNDAFINFHSSQLPDETDTVIELELI